MAFQKGKSGNPAGRKAGNKAIKTRIRQHAVDALDVLASVMLDSSVSTEQRLQAACKVADCAFGGADSLDIPKSGQAQLDGLIRVTA